MDNIRRGNRQLIKELNRTFVVNTILKYEPISRTKIAELTELSLSTVSNIVASLIEKGLVQETGEDKSKGGRKPIMLELNPRIGLAIGIKIGLDGIVAALVNLKGTVLYQISRSIPPKKDKKNVIKSVVEVIRNLVKEARIDFGHVIGCGIGVSGLVDSSCGALIYSAILGWKNIQFKKLLEKEFNIPVFVDKDVNALALGERRYGAARGINNFVCITIGTGIGAGIILNGEIYHGNSGGAGELGHTIIDKNGPLCYCGKHGCLETFSSESFIIKEAKKALIKGEKTLIKNLLNNNDLDNLSVSTIIEAAYKGDTIAKNIFEQAGKNLGIGISNFINIVDPEMILMEGRGMEAGKFILRPMQKAIKENSLLKKDIKIFSSRLGKKGWVIGAAELVLKEIFKAPIFKSKKKDKIRSTVAQWV
ncbi:ROK family transcriptional regulator [Candidatus Aerophobetes bacterium]|nr:ROK family transcriptional regulator [Candidatus Aerophobetes bacterium]